MDVLDRDDCLALLRTAPVGRLAVTIAAMPMVLPVRFRLADDRVFFRVVRGSALDAATNGTVIAFEADEITPDTLTGWSVVVVGLAQDALAADCPADLAAAGVPWAQPHSEHRIVALATNRITGRRIHTEPHPPNDKA
jgi:hypothetical protein